MSKQLSIVDSFDIFFKFLYQSFKNSDSLFFVEKMEGLKKRLVAFNVILMILVQMCNTSAIEGEILCNTLYRNQNHR
jgi:hypothetical protein